MLMVLILVLIALALFCVGIVYINEEVRDSDATVSYTLCLMVVVAALLALAWRYAIVG